MNHTLNGPPYVYENVLLRDLIAPRFVLSTETQMIFKLTFYVGKHSACITGYMLI